MHCTGKNRSEKCYRCGETWCRDAEPSILNVHCARILGVHRMGSKACKSRTEEEEREREDDGEEKIMTSEETKKTSVTDTAKTKKRPDTVD